MKRQTESPIIIINMSYLFVKYNIRIMRIYYIIYLLWYTSTRDTMVGNTSYEANVIY